MLGNPFTAVATHERLPSQSVFAENLLQQISEMLYLGSLRCRTNNLFIAGKNGSLPS